MKTASALIQLVALSACLAAQLSAPAEFRTPGMRRALQTIAFAAGPIAPPPAAPSPASRG